MTKRTQKATKLLIFLTILQISLAQINFFDDEPERIPKNKTVLQAEYKDCNQALATGRQNCIEKSSCCYFESYVDEFEEWIPQCFSIDVFLNYTIGNESAYLKRIGVSNFHSRVRNSSFCEIIDFDPKIKKVKNCQCLLNWSTQLKFLVVLLSVFVVYLKE